MADETSWAQPCTRRWPPDVATAPEIGFVHRKLPFAEIYFLANTSNHAVHHEAVFRVQGLAGEWWDPFTGKISQGRRRAAGSDLAPYESRVVVFSQRSRERAGRASRERALRSWI